MSRTYTDEELISELKRFYAENGRVPTKVEMNVKSGYPSYSTYMTHFGSWNKALMAVGFEINQKQYIKKLDGTERCTYCGRYASEILGFRQWIYPDGIRYCEKHGQGSDYVTGNLSIHSAVGRGRSGEILVLKTLEIGTEYDCNRISCGYKVDLYHNEYGKVDVKTSLFNFEYNKWAFHFEEKKEADTYICVGLSYTGKYVQNVWIVPNVDKIRDLITFTIKDTSYSLSTHEHWEVHSIPYNNTWQEMIANYQNGGCKIFK